MRTSILSAAAMAVILGASFAAGAQPRALFVPGPGADLKTLKLDAGAAAEAATEGGHGELLVHIDHAHPYPGVQIKAPAGGWDLSGYKEVVVELFNPGDHPVQVSLRVDDPKADGTTHCATHGEMLAPGASGFVRVKLKRPIVEPPFHLAGMRGYPWGIPSAWEKPGMNALDPAHVTRLIVFSPHPKADGAFAIRSIRAEGIYVAPEPPPTDAAKFFPFIDAFGQYIHRDWPGKIHTLAELQAAREQEAKELTEHPGPASFDEYGGWKDGPALAATGFFRTEKVNGVWWLVDPAGHLFFSQGIDDVGYDHGSTPVDLRDGWFADLPAKESAFKDCYHRAWAVVHGDYEGQTPMCFDFSKYNNERKYGADWMKAFADVSHRRLRSWGINTCGAWSSPQIEAMHRTAYAVDIGSKSKHLEGSEGYWGKFDDVFDPSFAKAINRSVHDQTHDSAHDPWCIGYFVHNELSWGNDGVSLAAAALKSPPDQAAKIEFLGDLKAKYGQIEKLNAAWGTEHASWDALLQCTKAPDAKRAHEDLSAFYLKFSRMYFSTIGDALKNSAPNHLYLGCRFSSENDAAGQAAAEYCDVVSFNVYHKTPDDVFMPLKADKPVLIGEFHFGALDRGMFHPGLVETESQVARAAAYRNYVETALRSPRIVGCHWFEYADEPTTGRYYDGENYQIGFIDVTDTPNAEIVAAARAVGDEMYAMRNSAVKK